MELIRRHRNASVFVLLLLLSVGMLSFSTSEVVLRPQQLGSSLVATVQSAVHGARTGVTNTVNSVRELGRLREEHDLLLERVAQYETIEQDVQALRDEIDRLNEVIGFSQTLRFENVPARIIGKDPGNHFATITINRGTRHGVGNNMAVIAVQDGRQGLVGRIQEAGPFSSQIMPIFDASSFVAARLERSRYEGLVQGGGIGSELTVMRYVNSQARNEIRYGDIVITSGMNSIYPPGIPIGVVESVQARPYETSLELGMRSLVDFGRLEHVFVVGTE